MYIYLCHTQLIDSQLRVFEDESIFNYSDRLRGRLSWLRARASPCKSATTAYVDFQDESILNVNEG